jgi:predicted enzyme related to lactoylglutathione lyase
MRHGLTILATDDLKSAATFYDQILGVDRQVNVPVYVEYLLEGGQRIGLYDGATFETQSGAALVPHPAGSNTRTELYFFVDDLAGAEKRLHDAGARLLSARRLRDWGDQAAYYQDPMGNVLVVAHPSREDGTS